MWNHNQVKCLININSLLYSIILANRKNQRSYAKIVNKFIILLNTTVNIRNSWVKALQTNCNNLIKSDGQISVKKLKISKKVDPKVDSFALNLLTNIIFLVH